MLSHDIKGRILLYDLNEWKCSNKMFLSCYIEAEWQSDKMVPDDESVSIRWKNLHPMTVNVYREQPGHEHQLCLMYCGHIDSGMCSWLHSGHLYNRGQVDFGTVLLYSVWKMVFDLITTQNIFFQILTVFWRFEFIVLEFHFGD